MVFYLTGIIKSQMFSIINSNTSSYNFIRLGRKIAAYIFIVASVVINILQSILIYFKPFDLETQQLSFAVLRFLSGIASNVYSVCVVLAIEVVGPSWRVTAANSIYYLYILGEFVVVLFAYFISDYKVLYASYTLLMFSFMFYFWLVPESPRWLITKNRSNDAYKIFKRIARSNKKVIENLNEIEELNLTGNNKNENSASNIAANENDKQSTFSIIETLKIFFKSKKLMIRSSVILLNWLTNTFVYYGISFNTSALSGDPYLNFTLSVFVELIAIVTCQFTLEKFGRKKPYAINMIITGVALLLIQFVPKEMSYMVTILALIGKFSISFTYNSVYIITSEIHPTVIRLVKLLFLPLIIIITIIISIYFRNSAVSLCQAFARMGAIIAPSIQLMVIFFLNLIFF
jgi:MFS transporter, OCT family, solute carrier family 22 (organic cation transporter), member 4/5